MSNYVLIANVLYLIVILIVLYLELVIFHICHGYKEVINWMELRNILNRNLLDDLILLLGLNHLLSIAESSLFCIVIYGFLLWSSPNFRLFIRSFMYQIMEPKTLTTIPRLLLFLQSNLIILYLFYFIVDSFSIKVKHRKRNHHPSLILPQLVGVIRCFHGLTQLRYFIC